MKNWHWLVIIAVVYLVGVWYPAPGKVVLNKIGVSV